ncbi:MAG: nuclear transport factor 2 family protein [Anaerolineales bacterium]|jgi:ketosteroid isomerase-like protein
MEDSILSLENQAMERWRKGDPWGFVEMSAGDITYVDPGLAKPITGLEEYKAYMRQIEGKVHYQGSKFIQPKVVVLGDAAVLSYNYRSSELSPDGKVLNQTPWNATEVYFWRDGQWKIVHTHWSFIKHKLPEILEVPIPVQLAQQEYPGVLGEIMVLESAAMERWRKGDPGGFIDLYTPEATYLDSGTLQRLGGEDLRAELARRKGQIYYDVMEFIGPGIQVQGDMAVLFYRFFSTRLNPDGSIASRIPWNCSEVYIRCEGQWRILHNHWSYIKGQQV